MHNDIPQKLLQALLRPLMTLLLPFSNDDKDAAWDDAIAATTSFEPRTILEFRLAARIAVHSIRANQCAAKAAEPRLPVSEAIRLSQCGLSYTRDADKAERQLEKLQAARLKEEQAQPETEEIPTPDQDIIDQAEPPATAQLEQPTAAQDPIPQTATIPAYKLLKQLRRQAKQEERDARMQAQSQGPAPDVPAAA
jgi:hypothetical protein